MPSTLLALASCATLTRASQIAANAALIADWAQTEGSSDGGTWHRFREANPIMGGAPSVVAISSYMTSCIIAANLIGSKIPEWSRPLWYLGIAGFEMSVIKWNADDGARVF